MWDISFIFCIDSIEASVVEFDADIFAEGEYLAVIDCMTFVPEFHGSTSAVMNMGNSGNVGNLGHGKSNPRYIPVLKALEKQSESTLPFEDRFEQAFESQRIRFLFQNASTTIVKSWKTCFETTYHVYTFARMVPI